MFKRVRPSDSKRVGLPGRAASFFQPKLRVNQPGDAFEQEADRVADRVVGMPAPSGGQKYGGAGLFPAGIQRTCAKCAAEEPGTLQRRAAGGDPAGGQTAPPGVGGVLAESGRPLESGTRHFMESRFGQDFSQVRIHDDARAGESADAISARAYTGGSDIVFAKNEYRPDTTEGRRLLAHELTHVVQQTGPASGIQRDDLPAGASPLEKVRDFIAKKDWANAYSTLWAETLPSMLNILATLSQTELDALRANVNTVYTLWAMYTPFAAFAVVRVALCVIAAYLAKYGKDPVANKTIIDTAKASLPFISFAERGELIDWLKPYKKTSASAAALLEFLSKPLQGYTASGLDFSKRFFQHADKLGFTVENASLGAYASDPYGTGSQPSSVTDPAQKSFEKSDILFFSGHQYAQYKQPGVFTNDASDSCFNLGLLSNDNKRVKMVVSTSCATICKDPIRIWKKKFPGAVILGYQYSAPTNGGIVANAFAAQLQTKGPLNLSDAGGLGKVRDAWKAVVLGHGVGGGPGIYYKDKVEIRSGKKWTEVAWDDKANECHYH